MKLKKLEITGFKSFLEKAVLKFPKGISAIVGPNGCGKSNVVDALRWVMGEQSVKQLRGKSAEDIIFAGTDGRPGSNIAEVSLTLENDENSPDSIKDYTEVMITRRVYRSGETAYLLNKQPCRLKDIHNIFLGSGMGSRSFAVIQQGNIGAITDAGPDERRIFIEEAAGVTKFKARKKETLKKIETTRDNILRVDDIILEIKQRMNSLSVQVRNAEKYREYQTNIKRLDLISAVYYHDFYNAQIDDTQKKLTEFSSNEIELSTKIVKYQSLIERVKLNLLNKGQDIENKKQKIHELQRNMDSGENNLKHLRNEIVRLDEEISELERSKIEIEQKNESIKAEIEEAKKKSSISDGEIDRIEEDLNAELQKLSELEKEQRALNENAESENFNLMELTKKDISLKNKIENHCERNSDIERRLKIADEELISLTRGLFDKENEKKKLNNELEELIEEVSQFDQDTDSYKKSLAELKENSKVENEKLRSVELEKNRIQSKHSTLKKMDDSHEWYRDGVRAVKKRMVDHFKLDPTDKPLIADILTSDPGYEDALEVALGDSIQYFLVDESGEGIDYIEYLRKFSKGRSGFIPVLDFRANENNKDLNGADLLINHVGVKEGFGDIAGSILGNILCCDDIDDALKLSRDTGHPVVTKLGDLVTENGIISGGSKDKLLGVIAKKKEIKDLETRLEVLDSDLEKHKERISLVDGDIKKLEDDLEKTLKYREESIKDRTDVEKSIFRVDGELGHGKEQISKLETERENLETERESLLDEQEKNIRESEKIVSSVKESGEKIRKITETITGITEKAEVFNKKVMELKLQLNTLKTQSEGSSSTLKRLESFLDDGLKSLTKNIETTKRNSQRKVKAAEEIGLIEKNLLTSGDVFRIVREELSKSEDEHRTIEKDLKDNETELSRITKEKDEIVSKIRFYELEQSQRKMKKENIAARVLERYHENIEFFELEYREEIEKEKINNQEDLEKIEEDLSGYRKKLNKLGDVNLGAISEYEEIKERFDFLTIQKEDLEKSIRDMEEIIQKINKVTQEKFIAIFNEINLKLGDVFTTLFDGGKAELIMTEPSKPLETGVELMIQPPGKKVARLSLLSGGEKALSAIAFVFSIFLIKPASFCILDEIDAPLDDSNVFRFNKLLKIIGERSQILMITHNKTTMEFADILFGITMEKKGISKVVSVNFDRERG